MSAWLVARGEGAATLAPGGTLGGSQAGLRVAFRPFADRPVALFARASRPLQTRGAEAALGVEVQPFARLPVRAAIEQRIALEDGAAEGTALSLIGGFDDVALAGGFRLNGYGQAGIIGLNRRAGFADGAVSAARPVAAWGDTELLLGAGDMGRSAARPCAARYRPARRAAAADRRRARPAGGGMARARRGRCPADSGPALTIGTDF